jgi:hypothetical protein
MARRPPEEVINVMIRRETHAKARVLQFTLNFRTIDDAIAAAIAALEASQKNA